MLYDDCIALPGGPSLALRRADGPARPFLLVHGLASNSRLWDAVALRLAAAGHEVVAVDQRGHGRSEEAVDGYDTATCAGDLSALIDLLGWTGDRAPIVAGQSWGGNVVLTLAANHGRVAAVALVDGGWIHLQKLFPAFEECWDVLAPPRFDGIRYDDMAARAGAWHADWPVESQQAVLGNFAVDDNGFVRNRLARDHHRSILHSLWADDPADLYSRVSVPVLLMPAVREIPDASPAIDAAAAIAGARIEWYVGAHHDLHAEQPDRCAADLLALAEAVA